jgi:hypothetical protein
MLDTAASPHIRYNRCLSIHRTFGTLGIIQIRDKLADSPEGSQHPIPQWPIKGQKGTLGRDKQIMKELIMTVGRRLTFALYVDRSSQQWIVLDPQGQFWIVPANEENAWDQRQPFCPTDETELEPVPGHYKYMLGLPV